MLVIVASVVIFIYGMMASMLGSIVPGLGVQLALTNVEISYLALAQGIGLAATSVFAGALMDRSGKKIGVVLGLVASIVGLGTLSHPLNLTISIVAMALLGIGGSLVIVGANAIVNDVADERRASALNVLNLFVGLGGMATPFVAGNLLHSEATAVAYAGAAIAVLALLLVLFTPMAKAAPATQGEQKSGGIFSSGILYVLSLITFLYTAGEFAIWTWLPRYLIAKGIPSSLALTILSLGFALGILLGRFGAAFWLTKADPYKVLLSITSLAAVTTFAILHCNSWQTTAAAVFVSGLAMAPIFPTTIAIVGRIFRQRGATAIGFAITCGFSGFVLSSPFIGWISGPDPLGIGRGLLVVPSVAVIIVATLLIFRSTLTAQSK